MAKGIIPFHYGLPEFQSEGIKIAHHVTVVQEETPFPAKALEEFITEHFVAPIEKCVYTESCLYASTPNEDFIMDLLPNDKRVAIGSACSGHGFKFAPLTGKILSELILDGSTTISEFEPLKPLFSLRQ